MPLEGQQFGRYRFEHLLGSGGMGEVYLATDTLINRQVAIKVIRAEVASYPNATQEASRLFQREMKAISQLDHPHILPLFDYGEETINSAGDRKSSSYAYLVMPYRPEGSLVTWLQERGHMNLLTPGEVSHVVDQAADALQHAHNRKIIHQDVKPANFLIRSKEGHPDHPDLFLADFGVAKFSTATASASQSIRGTPTYMAPEQWEGSPVSASDQYALAVMAYELLAGRPPFQGPLLQVMYQHVHTPPPPPSTFNPRLNAEIDTVLSHALAKKPGERFASISAFARALQEALQGVDTSRQAGQGTDMPTLANTQNIPGSSDIRATLAISKAEALSGTNRTLTLPGGRRITITVPAGVYDGQVIRLEGQGEASHSGSPVGSLILVIALSQPEEYDSTQNADSKETVISSGSFSNATSGATIPSPPESKRGSEAAPAYSFNDAREPAFSSAANRDRADPVSSTFDSLRDGKITVNHRSSSRSRMILLIILALLVIAGGTGVFYVISSSEKATVNTSDTATTLANSTATSVALTGSVNKVTSGTATSQAQTTATVLALLNQYTSLTSGTPLLDDPLSDNSKGYAWEEGSKGVLACTFQSPTGGNYHVIQQQNGYTQPCPARKTHFSNFVYQARVTIFQGDEGGIIFRDDESLGRFYYFHIDTNGNYGLDSFNFADSAKGTPLKQGSSSTIHSGTGTPNLLTVVVNGNRIDLYINQQYVDSAIDSSYSGGEIGVAATDNGNPTDVAFSDVRVWKL